MALTEGFQVEAIDHVEVFVPSRREAARWYQNALGLRPVSKAEHWSKTPDGPLMISSQGFDAAGRTMVALFRGEPRGHRPTAGFHRLAFRVSGELFLQALDHLARIPVFDDRGQPLNQLKPVDHQAAFSIYFCDPWGHRLEVTTYDAALVRSAFD